MVNINKFHRQTRLKKKKEEKKEGRGEPFKEKRRVSV